MVLQTVGLLVVHRLPVMQLTPKFWNPLRSGTLDRVLRLAGGKVLLQAGTLQATLQCPKVLPLQKLALVREQLLQPTPQPTESRNPPTRLPL